ncbi:MAG: dockerin type I domain-containing protein [Acutalibacteraceae bacterium]
MKRKLRTAVCLGLTAFVMISCISGASAVTADKILSSGIITVNPSKVSDDFLVMSGTQSNEQNIIDAVNDIKAGAIEFKESVNISKYNIDKADAKILFNYLRYENPELINISNSFSYNYYSNGILCNFYLDYLFTGAEKDTYFTPFNEAVDKIVKQAEKQPTDFLKALYVHDYIVLDCEYATEVYDNPEKVSDFVYNAYGSLVEKRCVCQGYSMAYKAVMKRLSIPVDYALSEEMNHIWNTVTLDGNTYHADLTFDDPVPDMQGYVGHSNFLCTDEEITAEGHYSWTSASTISESSYPNRFWNDIQSRICINGDEVIYGAYDSTKKSYLERRSLTTNEASVIPSALSGVYWLTTDGSGYYSGCYSRLELINGVLYYSLPNGVNAIALDGSDDQSVYTLPDTASGRLYGFVQKDGKFYGEITTALSTDGNVIELALSEFKRSFLLGDVDGDGRVSMLDAILAQKTALRLIKLDERGILAADFNGDGIISMYDALMIQRAVLTM